MLPRLAFGSLVAILHGDPEWPKNAAVAEFPGDCRLRGLSPETIRPTGALVANDSGDQAGTRGGSLGQRMESAESVWAAATGVRSGRARGGDGSGHDMD